MSRPMFEATRALVRGVQSTSTLVKKRDAQGLLAQGLQEGMLEKRGIKNVVLQKIAITAMTADIFRRETVEHCRELYERSVATFVDTDFGARTNEYEFGSISINPVKDTHEYILTDKSRWLYRSSIELHLDPFPSATPRDALRGLGRAATHIGESSDLMQYEVVTSVSYPELVHATIRLGMRRANVHVIDPQYSSAIALNQSVFYLMNGISNGEPCYPEASYLPTEEFVDRFSRFAEPLR